MTETVPILTSIACVLVHLTELLQVIGQLLELFKVHLLLLTNQINLIIITQEKINEAKQ